MKKFILFFIFILINHSAFSQFYFVSNHNTNSNVNIENRSTSFINPNVGFTVANILDIANNTYYLTLLRTSNKGYTWYESNISTFNDNNINQTASVSFINENTGYALFNNTIAKTTDGGFHWPVVHPFNNFSNNTYSSIIKFYNENIGYLILQADDVNYLTFYKTTDGGNSWGSQGGFYSTDHNNPRKYYVNDIATASFC